MRSPLCACAHSRVTDASCAILHRPAVAVETPPQSHTTTTWSLSEKKRAPYENGSLEPNRSQNSGAKPVSARVFWAARDVGDRQPLPFRLLRPEAYEGSLDCLVIFVIGGPLPLRAL